MAEQVNLSGKVVRVHSHSQMCPVPNAVAEVLRLNNKIVFKHEHVWAQGSNLRLPDGSYARVMRCRLTRCGIRVMVMLEPIEARVWESGQATGSTISERARK